MLALDRYIKFLDRTITARVSLVVAIRDEFTGRLPIGRVGVFNTRLTKMADGEEKPLEAIRNRSGYYLFLDLPKNQFTIKVESECYFDEEIAPSDVVETITLKPKPCYPFPSTATLIRGEVKDSERKPVSGAKVEVIGKEASNKTTDKGEFVLYFGVLTEEEVIPKGSKIFVKGDSGKTINVRVTADSRSGTAKLKEVEEGKTTVLKKPIIVGDQ